MNIQELQEYFNLHPAALNMGAGKIGKRTHTNPIIVREAKRIYRLNQSNNITRNNRLPKILIFDIETAPVKAYVWKTWKENISLDQITNDWFILCWSAKWLYSDEILGDCLTTEEVKQEDDSRIVKSLWGLFNECDILIAHNISHFDVPKMNTRFIKNNLVPPTPYYTIDTLQVAKKNFGFTSNKLEGLARFFGFEGKMDTDFNLWKDCMEGKQEALDYMYKYNKQDVVVLEEVYLKLAPWIKGGPNIANYVGTNIPVCCRCGEEDLEVIPNKYYYTTVGKYTLYRCKNCGAISRGRINLNKEPVLTTTVLK